MIYTDDHDDFELTNDQISAESSIETLVDWWTTCRATIESMKGQAEFRVCAGQIDVDWVFRATKAAGFYRAAETRIRDRLLVLGHDVPDQNRRVAELNRKLHEAQARREVADRFYLMAQQGEMDRLAFLRLEAKAVKYLADKVAEKAARKAA